MIEFSNQCRNCNKKVEGSYCSICGQRKGIYRVTFKETFQDFVDASFSVNAPLLKTVRLLFVNPGKLFREYLSGKRKPYYKPISFFILATIVYLIIRSFLQYDPMKDSMLRQSKEVENSLFFKAGRFMVVNINNIMFLFVLNISLFLKLFFFKKNYWIEFIAISFYLVGIYTFFGILPMLFFVLTGSYLKILPAILFIFYVLYALISYFKSYTFLTFLKIFLAYIFSFIFYVATGYALSLLIVWIKKN